MLPLTLAFVENLYNHTLQSLDNPTCAESVWLHKTSYYNLIRASNNNSVQFDDHQHENMMKDYYKHNQDKMTPDEIRELKLKSFPYLSNDSVCLNMSDRNIIRKELDLNTDSVLSDNDKQSMRDIDYSTRECLSTHDNPSIQNNRNLQIKGTGFPVVLIPNSYSLNYINTKV